MLFDFGLMLSFLYFLDHKKWGRKEKLFSGAIFCFSFNQGFFRMLVLVLFCALA
jgi:hypothetical protein